MSDIFFALLTINQNQIAVRLLDDTFESAPLQEKNAKLNEFEDRLKHRGYNAAPALAWRHPEDWEDYAVFGPGPTTDLLIAGIKDYSTLLKYRQNLSL